MTSPVRPPIAATLLDYSCTLRIRLKESLRKIENRLVEIKDEDNLADLVKEWKSKFQQEMRTNGDLNPILAAHSDQLVQILKYHPLLSQPFTRFSKTHRLIESLVYFLKTYNCANIPLQLEEAYQKILEAGKTAKLVEERDQAIQAIQARQVQEERRKRSSKHRPTGLPPNVHTLATLKERHEREIRENIRKIRELEQQLTPDNVHETLETLSELKEQAREINSQAQQQIASVLNLESLQPSTTVIENSEDQTLDRDWDLFDRLEALARERDQEKNQAIAKKRQQMQSRIDARMPEILAPIDAVERLNNENAAVVKEELNKMAQKDEEIAKEQIAAINVLKNEMLELDKRTIEATRRLDNSQLNLSQLEKDNLKKEIAYNEAKRALKKQQKGGLKKLLVTAAITTGCVLASWGLGAACGIGASAIPYGSGAGVVVSLGASKKE